MTTRNEFPARRKTDVDTGREPKLRILAADDDPAYLRYLEIVLTRSGFDVVKARDGAAAIECLRSGVRVDLLLIDLSMPGMDGIETVRRIHEDSALPGLYTILLTSRDAVETKLRALDSGLDDFLSKMASESEIVAKIRSAARRLDMERRLQTLAMTDELTGIANRRALFLAADNIFRMHRRLAVVLFDLDHFKAINDTFGHVAGDRILTQVASVLQETTRFGDVVGRYGGDEFLLLLPDTDTDEAVQIAERVSSKIRGLSISAQFGVAAATTTLSDAIAICDKALYKGKGERPSRQQEEARVQRDS